MNNKDINMQEDCGREECVNKDCDICDAIATRNWWAKESKRSEGVNWEELRDQFFKECTDYNGAWEQIPKINMAPHNLFEWFKSKVQH